MRAGGKPIVVVSGENVAAIIRWLRPDLTVRVSPLAHPGQILAIDFEAEKP